MQAFKITSEPFARSFYDITVKRIVKKICIRFYLIVAL